MSQSANGGVAPVVCRRRRRHSRGIGTGAPLAVQALLQAGGTCPQRRKGTGVEGGRQRCALALNCCGLHPLRRGAARAGDAPHCRILLLRQLLLLLLLALVLQGHCLDWAAIVELLLRRQLGLEGRVVGCIVRVSAAHRRCRRGLPLSLLALSGLPPTQVRLMLGTQPLLGGEREDGRGESARQSELCVQRFPHC